MLERQKTIRNACKLKHSESELNQRINVTLFLDKLLEYDVISFDIFDTLILRPFAKPVDVFFHVGRELGIDHFSELRIETERNARELAKRKNQITEVSIEDIYRIIEKKTGISQQKGIDVEFAMELKYCFANPYMREVYNYLRDNNKVIIITSDMYLPSHLMKVLLSHVGFDGYEKLYVSCDYRCNKNSGGLYQKIIDDHLESKIIHVGDNVVSDIFIARKMGIDAVLYRNCHDVGCGYRIDEITDYIASAYDGVINTHLHNGIKVFSQDYEYGFVYCGLYYLAAMHMGYQLPEEINRLLQEPNANQDAYIGMMDFCNEYLKYFSEEPIMLEIQESDAVRPYSTIQLIKNN